MRILITGSRDWVDASLIDDALASLNADMPSVLVSGHCPSGADLFAELYAKRVGWDVELHPADWAQFGSFAGPKRNQEMVDSGFDVMVAFVKDASRGTMGTVRKGITAGGWVKVYSLDSMSNALDFAEYNVSDTIVDETVTNDEGMLF